MTDRDVILIDWTHVASAGPAPTLTRVRFVAHQMLRRGPVACAPGVVSTRSRHGTPIAARGASPAWRRAP